MQNVTLELAAAMALSGALCLPAADWPSFRGPNANGISPETVANTNWNAKPPQVLWKMELGDSGYAGPSVADGKLFIIDHNGSNDVVRAVDIRNGSNVWTHAYPDADAANFGFARATPTVNQGKVYTLGRLGVLNCLDARDGKPVWTRNIVTEFKGQMPKWQMAGSPFVDGDKLIVCPGGPDAAVVALDKDTGKTLWQGGGSDKAGYSTPAAATISGKKQYVVFTGAALIGADAGNGKVLWRLPWKTDYDVNAATPIVVGTDVFITSGYEHGCALVDVSGASPAIKWQNKALKAHFNSPIYKDGYVYGIGDDGVLTCIDIKTGKAAWEQWGFEKGGVAGTANALIAVDGKGGAVALADFSPAKYTELGRITPLGGQSWTAPIVAQGKLFVRNKSALVCISLE